MNYKQTLGAVKTWVEDKVLTAPAPFLRSPASCDADHLNNLATQGYTSLGKVIDAAELAEIRQATEDAIGGGRPDLKLHWQENVSYWVLKNPLRLHPKLLTLAADPAVIAIVDAHLRRKSYLADVDFRRVMPIDMSDLDKKVQFTSSSWHRDNRGRQLKMMVYMTDVGSDDSCFSLIPGSHHGENWRKRDLRATRFTDDEAVSLGLPRLDWVGTAGEAMLFDTNLIHRLTRRPHARLRDTVTYYYTPGQALRYLDYNADWSRSSPVAKRILGEPGHLLQREAAIVDEMV